MSGRVLTPDGKHGRKCRVCDREKLVNPDTAKRVYPSFPWGDKDLCDRADMICPFCKAAYYEHGERLKNGNTAYWVRTVSTKNRAYQLYQSYDRKPRDECRKRITAGEARAANPGDVA